MLKGVTLYNFKTAEIRILEGDVTPEKYFAVFRPGNASNLFWRCSVDPGVIQDRVFWLPERDDEKAKKIISYYLRRKIKECEKELDNHLYTLSQLDSQFFHRSL